MSVESVRNNLQQASQELTASHTEFRGAEMDFGAAGNELGAAKDTVDELVALRDRISDLANQLTGITDEYDRALGAIALHTSNAEEAAKRGLASSQNAGTITDTVCQSVIDATNGSNNPRLVAAQSQAKAVYIGSVGPSNPRSKLAVSETTRALQNLGDPSALTEYLQETAEQLAHHAKALGYYMHQMHDDNAKAQAATDAARELHVDAGNASLGLAETTHQAAESL